MRSPPEMALTRLASRGDLSQLRWARWQSARSFHAHPLYAYALPTPCFARPRQTLGPYPPPTTPLASLGLARRFAGGVAARLRTR
jgi:hypothetical protein